MRIVIDASVALKWVIPEANSAAANALRGEELIAPSLWLVEAGNGLWRHARLGKISADEGSELFSLLASAPVACVPIEPHIERALTIANQIGHPVYDCLYLAVALYHDTHVVTADRRFGTAAAASHPGRVRVLSTV